MFFAQEKIDIHYVVPTNVHCKYFDGDFIDWKIITSSLVPFMLNYCVYCNLKQLSPTVMFFAQKHFKRRLTFIIMFPMNFLSKEQQLKVKFRVNLSIKLFDSLILIEKQPHTCKTICVLQMFSKPQTLNQTLHYIFRL